MRGTREVVLLDDAGREVGLSPLEEAHAGEGLLHRAFTAVLFDARGQVVLGRRAPGKPLWPGWWDATVASHPRPGEAMGRAAERRLVEELGVRVDLVEVETFRYHAPFGGAGSERESCAALFGWLGPDVELAPHPEEIDAVRSVSVGDLLGGAIERVCPWAWLAFECALESGDPRFADLRQHGRSLAERLTEANFERLG